MNRFVLFLLLSLLSANSLQSAPARFIGKVRDAKTGHPLPGSAIRILNTNKGTYSDRRGIFLLPSSKNEINLKISSIGYKSKTVKAKSSPDTLLIKLEPSPIEMKNAEIIGRIDANNIIKRTIRRKQQNLDKLKTFTGLLYTKFVAELGGSVFAEEAGEKEKMFGGAGPEKAGAEYKMFVLETFSRNYYDKESNIDHTVILKRRQTANIPPSQNLLAMGTFFNLYSETIGLMDANIISPLADDAPDFYNYTLTGRTVYEDKYIYLVDFKPKTSLYPTFTGSLKIIEGSYDLIEADIRPSENTVVKFVDSLRITQRFIEAADSVWYPDFLELSGIGGVEIIKGLVTVKAHLKSTSIYSEIEINKPLPDSVLKNYYKPNRLGEQRRLIVSPDADSSDSKYWENNSLRSISLREKQIYDKVDSVMALKDSVEEEKSIFDYSISPALDFNRVGSVVLGISPDFSIYEISLNPEIKYSFGQKDWYGYFGLGYTLKDSLRTYMRLETYLESDITTFGTRKPYPMLQNMIAAGLFHEDYYDYYKSEEWRIFMSTPLLGFNLAAGFIYSNQYSLVKTTNTSAFSKKNFRPNPEIVNGKYSIGKIIVGNDPYNFISISTAPVNRLSYLLSGASISERNTGKEFYQAEAWLGYNIETFFTGYSPMTLGIELSGGIASDDIPVQYSFIMPAGLAIFGRSASFLTADPAIFGGNKFFTAFTEYNFTDFFWRAVGLPALSDGRGPDMKINLMAGYYENKNSNIYFHTKDKFYTEAGFALTRIPTFLSDIIYLGFDARWGFGDLAKGKFGWSLSLTTPF